jgi:hypothetical protein
MRRFYTIVLTLLLVSITVAPALAARGTYTLERIANAYHDGEISFDEYIMYSVFAGFAADQVPSEFVGPALAEHPMDATSLLTMAYSNWDKVSAETRDMMSYYLPGGEGSAICGPYDVNLHPWGAYVDYGGQELYHYDTDVGNYTIWYVLGGPHAVDPTDSDINGYPDVVDKYAADCEYAFDSTCNERGWGVGTDAPQGFFPVKDILHKADWLEFEDVWNSEIPNGPNVTDWGMDNFGPPDNPGLIPSDTWDMHLGNLGVWGMGGGVLGVTVYYSGAWDNPCTDRQDEPSFCMFPQTYDVTPGYPTDETVAHEFFHCIENMYCAGPYIGVGCDAFTEMCTTWNEEQTYPDHNNYITTRLGPAFNTPYKYLWSVNATDAYEHTIWAFFIQSFGQNTLHGMNPPDNDALENVWKYSAKGDEWYTGSSSLGDSSVYRDIMAAIGFWYRKYLDTSITPTTYDKNYALDRQFFQELFVTYTGWNWFTGARDPGNEWYYEGSLYPEVHVAATWSNPGDFPLVDEDISPVYRPSCLGVCYIECEALPSWGSAVFKFLGDPGNDTETRQWDGWLMKKKGLNWEWERFFCPWDNGIVRVDNLAEYTDITLVISNKSIAGDYPNNPLTYSVIEPTESTPPNIYFTSVVLDSQPEYVAFAIGADEQLHGVPLLDVSFTPQGETTAQVTHILVNQPDLAVPSYNYTYNITQGKTGNGTILIKGADVNGNISEYTRDFAAGIVPAGMAATLGNDQVDLFLPPGCTSKTSTILVIEEPIASTVSANNETVTSNLLSNGFTGMSKVNGEQEQKVELLGRAYRIEPGWMDLNGEAQLTMSYVGLDVTDESKVSLYRADGNGGWVEIGGEINPKYDRISAKIGSFGVYALGYGTKGTMGEGGGEQPVSFSLSQNYPNPFSAGTTIKYSLAEAVEVSIKVYNLSGQLVEVLVNEVQQPGNFTLNWDGKDENGKHMASGVYIYQMNAGSFQSAKKMVLVR